MKDIKVLIIPDVHGRTFWRDALAQFPIESYPDLQIIFLGDYLDPYMRYENITQEDAFAIFNEILSINDPRITLLIGNHDWHYFVNIDTCRMDFARERIIEKLFKDNMHRFSLYKIVELNDKKYIFSHAGITQKWLDTISSMAKYECEHWNPGNIDPAVDSRYSWISKMSTINKTYDFTLFDECLKNYDDNFYTCPISMISYNRGGSYGYGSLIWADAHEHIYMDDIDGYYQIFGHTMSFPTGVKDYAISPNGKNWAMLDASQAFIMDDDGNIEPLN